MFGTDLHMVTFIIILLECFILMAAVYYMFTDKPNQNAKRFAWLTVCYILYNLFSGIWPDPSFPYFSLQPILLDIVGINLCFYIVYYLYKTFDIRPFDQSFIRVVTLISVIFIIYLFVENLLHEKDSRTIFLMVMSLFAGAILLQVLETIQKRESLSFQLIAVYIALLSTLMLPVIIYIFGPVQVIEQPVVNSGFFALAYAYIREHDKMKLLGGSS